MDGFEKIVTETESLDLAKYLKDSMQMFFAIATNENFNIWSINIRALGK